MKTIKKVFISEGSDIGRTNLFCVEYDSDNEQNRFHWVSLPCMAVGSLLLVQIRHSPIAWKCPTGLQRRRDYMLNQDLKNAIQTLHLRNGTTTGKVLLRSVSSNNSSYIPVTLGTSNYNMIMSNASSKNWNVVWDSGVNY